MTKTISILAALSLALGASGAGAYSLDAKGKCHDDHGKFAKAGLCVHHTYKADAKGKCRDEKGHFAKADFCKK